MKRLAVLLAVLALAGCKATVTTTADKPAPSSSKSASASPTKAAAKVGDAITLKGNDDGEQMTVTVLKVVSTATPGNPYFGPDKGMRWIAVQFLLKDTGKTPYDDSPSNGSVVVDGESQQYDATIADKIKQGALLPAGVKLPVGGQAKGFIIYEVPKKAKIVGVQFSLDSGFGSTAQWVIG